MSCLPTLEDLSVTNITPQVWQSFEVSHGNEDTFREMLRIKRSVKDKVSHQVKLTISLLQFLHLWMFKMIYNNEQSPWSPISWSFDKLSHKRKVSFRSLLSLCVPDSLLSLCVPESHARPLSAHHTGPTVVTREVALAPLSKSTLEPCTARYDHLEIVKLKLIIKVPWSNLAFKRLYTFVTSKSKYLYAPLD